MPADADPPVVQLGGRGSANGALTWYFVQKLPGTPGKLSDYARQVEDIIRPRLETIEGVAGVELLDGAPEQVQIIIDPYRAAELGLPLTDIAATDLSMSAAASTRCGSKAVTTSSSCATRCSNGAMAGRFGWAT
jgi:multidrug efflux pump subunit AcrB